MPGAYPSGPNSLGRLLALLTTIRQHYSDKHSSLFQEHQGEGKKVGNINFFVINKLTKIV